MSPIVLVTSDTGEREQMRTHMVMHNYLRPLLAVGATPLVLPNLGGGIDLAGLLTRIDGVLVTGAASNVHPSLYGRQATPAEEPFDPHRDATTLPLIRAAIEKGIPLLAICRGIQELNVALGGTLNPNLSATSGELNHRNDTWADPDELFGAYHPVEFSPDSQLAATLGAATLGEGPIAVNSAHRQAIDRLSDRLIVEATAGDGTIEAVRVAGAAGFAFGVQWHPEYAPAPNPHSDALFQAFARALAGQWKESS